MERIFRAVVESHSPRREDLDALARDAAAAAAMTIISRSNDHYTRTIDPARAGHATLRLRIVDAAVALLTGPPETVKRIKACPACGWFFRDDTRSATRKWCSMATCGSAAKSRRYYWRTKRSGDGRGDRLARQLQCFCLGALLSPDVSSTIVRSQTGVRWPQEPVGSQSSP